jgi:hypothetical protein
MPPWRDPVDQAAIADLGRPGFVVNNGVAFHRHRAHVVAMVDTIAMQLRNLEQRREMALTNLIQAEDDLKRVRLAAGLAAFDNDDIGVADDGDTTEDDFRIALLKIAGLLNDPRFSTADYRRHIRSALRTAGVKPLGANDEAAVVDALNVYHERKMKTVAKESWPWPRLVEKSEVSK